MIQLRFYLFFFMLFGLGVAKAQYTVLANFTDTGAFPGANSYGSLTPSGGILYGMAQVGGTNNDGVVFSFNPVGNVYTDLIDFTGNSGANPGKNPWGSLMLSGGRLYGVTTKGGTLGRGVLFSYDPVANTYTDLENFGDTIGDYPVGLLTLSGGLLYGMTGSGGANNKGVIFSYDPVGNVYTKLVNFTGTSGSNLGASPYGSLTLSGETFYGMTISGGANNKGVIFSYKPVGNIYTELISFTDTSGAYPGAGPGGSLTPYGDLLYGMTGSGGANNKGVIFSYNPFNGVYSVLTNFTGVSGTHPGTSPFGSLTLSGSILYGVTWFGGASDAGVIFSYDPTSNVYSDIVDFTGTTGTCPGENSQCTLTAMGDLLYGMTSGGGAYGDGVIFSLNIIGVKINNTRLDAVIKLFPDPNHGLFTLRVSSATSEPVSIIVTNTIGEKVKELHTTTNADTQINLAQQPTGNYFVTTLTRNQRRTEKIILE